MRTVSHSVNFSTHTCFLTHSLTLSILPRHRYSLPAPSFYPCESDGCWENNKYTPPPQRAAVPARPSACCLVDSLPASGSAPSSGPKPLLLLPLPGTVETSSPPANQLVSRPAFLPSCRLITPQQTWQWQALVTVLASR